MAHSFVRAFSSTFGYRDEGLAGGQAPPPPRPCSSVLKRPASAKGEAAVAASIAKKPATGPGPLRRLTRMDAQVRDMTELQAGPQSSAELWAYPSTIVQQLLKDSVHGREREENIRRIGAVCAYSDYSGYDSPREALRLSTIALGKLGIPFQYQWARSCDKAAGPRSALVALARQCDGSRSCVMTDINDRLPASILLELDKLEPNARPDRSDPASVKAAADARASQGKLLLERIDEAFPPGALSKCLVHKGNCPVRVTRGRAMELLGDEMDKDKAQPNDVVMMNISGNTCAGWTPAGQKLGSADPSEREHDIFVADRLASGLAGEEDIFVTECSDKYPPEKLSYPLADVFTVMWIITSPLDMGHPVKRSRIFCAGINKQTRTWTGPSPSVAGSIQTEFDRLFKASTVLSGDEYFKATPTRIQEEMSKLAALRGDYFPSGTSASTMSEDDLLAATQSPCTRMRIKAWDQVAQDCAEDLSGSFLADVKDWPGRSAGGRLFPPLLTNSTIRSWRLQRTALPEEHFLAQGVHFLPGLSEDFGVSPVVDAVARASGSAQKAMAGNAMHLAPLMAWILFVLSNTTARQQDRDMKPEGTDANEGNEVQGAAD